MMKMTTELTPLKDSPHRQGKGGFGSYFSLAPSDHSSDDELTPSQPAPHLSSAPYHSLAINTSPIPSLFPEPLDDGTPTSDAKAGFDADSLDYDTVYSPIFQSELRATTVTQFNQQHYFRWLITFMIGVATGLVAFIIDALTQLIAEAKGRLVVQLYDRCDNDCFTDPFVTWTFFAVGLVLVAALLVAFVEPVAGGSGIPEIKCYLNGVKIPRVVRLGTLVIKMVGTILGVSSGLPIGKEGPMIHSGAILAAGISQGSSLTANLQTPFFRDFRNDTAKRDFVAGGAAAGIAAAFGAPIGGVLFAIEEGASFWDQGLTWRTFLCSMTSTFTVNFLVTGTFFHMWGQMSFPGLLNLGTFESADAGWTAEQVPLFILIGIGGGLIGAAWIHLSTLVLQFRRRCIPPARRTLRVVDACLVAFLVAAVQFLFPLFFSPCSLVDPNVNNGTIAQMGCPEGYSNQLAILFMDGQENAIRSLIHSTYPFSYATLVIFGVFYFILMFLNFGIAIPGGLFIPSILLGASFGRIVGQGIYTVLPKAITPTLAALLGSSAVLGGVHRMTLSLTVLMIEAAGDMTYAIPIMISLWSAKLVGDFINQGIYDVQMHLKRLPLLDWEPPLAFRKFHARDVMNSPAVCFQRIESVQQIVATLRATSHNGYPVVDKQGNFAGLILRSQLVTILKFGLYCRFEEISAFYTEAHITSHSFLSEYPRYPDISSISLTPDDLRKFVDIGLFFNPVPFTVRRSCPLLRVFRIIRTMGLRHLPVVDSFNRPVGMITRHDLVDLEDRSSLNPQGVPGNYETDNLQLQSPNMVEEEPPLYDQI